MEIVQPLDLNEEQKQQLELHSVLNVLNLINYHTLPKSLTGEGNPDFIPGE